VSPPKRSKLRAHQRQLVRSHGPVGQHPVLNPHPCRVDVRPDLPLPVLPPTHTLEGVRTHNQPAEHYVQFGQFDHD